MEISVAVATRPDVPLEEELRMAESARAMRAFLSDGEAQFDGEVVSAHYRLRLDPPGGPLTVAAFGDRAIAVAAEHADRMVLDLVSPELASEYRAKLDALAERAGRRAPRLAAWIPAAVDPEPESRRQIMESLVGYLVVAGYDEMFTAAGFGKAAKWPAEAPAARSCSTRSRRRRRPPSALSAMPTQPAHGSTPTPPRSTRWCSSRPPPATPAASAP